MNSNFSSDKIFHRKTERLENGDSLGRASTWTPPDENVTELGAGGIGVKTAFLNREQILATFDLHLGMGVDEEL